MTRPAVTYALPGSAVTDGEQGYASMRTTPGGKGNPGAGDQAAVLFWSGPRSDHFFRTIRPSVAHCTMVTAR